MDKSGKKCIILLVENKKAMSNPTGTYNCKLDAKGRLMLPADFRSELGSQVEEDFILRPGLHGAYLELYTISDWNRRKEILMKVNPFDRHRLDIVRKYLDGVRRVKLDANGRLQIPKDLLERSGMTKEIPCSPTWKSGIAQGTTSVSTPSAPMNSQKACKSCSQDNNSVSNFLTPH